MNKRFEELSRRKQYLVAQCAEQRREMGTALSDLRSSVTLSGILQGLGKILRAHPMITAGISSLLASGYATKLTTAGSQLFKLLRVARPLWSWWSTRRRGEAKNA